MRTLRIDNFLKARAFVKTQARVLDRRLFAYYFEDGEAAGVVDALRAYQNPDGGFGHGLEPDFRLKASSPAATVMAFQYLVEIGATAEWAVVQSGIEYLLRNYDAGWPPVPPEVNDAPHAPWWSYRNQLPEVYWGNPGAEIVAYLQRYAELVPEEFLSRVTRFALFCLETRAAHINSSDLLCFARLLDNLPENSPEAVKLAERLAQLAASQRQGVRLWPWWAVNRPEARSAGIFRENLKAALDYEITHQQTDGAWQLHHSWALDTTAGEQAWREWKGLLTVRLLRALQNFGRIEDITAPGLSRPDAAGWGWDGLRRAARG